MQREQNQRVSRVTDNEVTYGEGRFVTDRLGNIKLAGEGTVFTANQQFPAEFFVGKRWRTRFTMQDHRGEARFDVEFRIPRKERVTVPAGTFDCFRVEGHGTFVRNTQLVRVETRVWFAPDRVRRLIARDELRYLARGRDGLATRFELVEFRQA